MRDLLTTQIEERKTKREVDITTPSLYAPQGGASLLNREEWRGHPDQREDK
jgi:hypothetical protein